VDDGARKVRNGRMGRRCDLGYLSEGRGQSSSGMEYGGQERAVGWSVVSKRQTEQQDLTGIVSGRPLQAR
jgi:hypothetical protein